MRFLSLRRIIVASVDLPTFLEGELGVNIIWRADRRKCKCKCPFPFHGDTDPSFSMTLHEDGWGYKCFGCASAGTIVEFFKDYYDIQDTMVAMEMICEHFGLRDEAKMISEMVESAGSFKDPGKELSSMHMVASRQCRLLLKRSGNDPEVGRWVNARYKELNKAVENGDYSVVEMVYDRACELFDERSAENA